MDLTTGKDKTPAPAPNSGAICSAGNPCKAKDENCLVLTPSSLLGMCLRKCSNGLCAAPNPATQALKCIQGNHCAFLCEAGGVSYKCPNDKDYSCTAAAQSSLKFCMPK